MLKADEFEDVIKLGRTHLQDAVPDSFITRVQCVMLLRLTVISHGLMILFRLCGLLTLVRQPLGLA